ncbi:MAG: hypothetical protein MZV63_66575 [Marinilabiliales bacterium]|nr:hypothetical protein [Marinilabiliales bacterium]
MRGRVLSVFSRDHLSSLAPGREKPRTMPGWPPSHWRTATAPSARKNSSLSSALRRSGLGTGGGGGVRWGRGRTASSICFSSASASGAIRPASGRPCRAPGAASRARPRP